MLAWAFDVINAQIAVVSVSYVNVVAMVVWIRVPYVVIVREVVHRTRVVVPVSVIVPGSPRVIPVIPGDDPDAGQIRVRFHLDVFYIDALSSLRHHVQFHHVIRSIIIRRYSYYLKTLPRSKDERITV